MKTLVFGFPSSAGIKYPTGELSKYVEMQKINIFSMQTSRHENEMADFAPNWRLICFSFSVEAKRMDWKVRKGIVNKSKIQAHIDKM